MRMILVKDVPFAFFLCRHLCAPVYSVFAACYFSTFPKCCDESDLQLILPSGLKEIIIRTPHPPEKKEKKD